ncbi:hypothetical protein [Marinimicrobium sp. ARAG 43.8]|uniref:hypothetical protein n=1 Tax=Marinimicrobium sp. ARAG 43.8 TaxID=3418719 RepID=UPI003CF32E9D
MQSTLDVINTIGVYSVIPAIPLVLLSVIFGIVLHNTLISRLDPILFKEPYFHKKELNTYVVWPLTILKTVGYILLVTSPKMAKWKRFKGFSGTLPVGKSLIVLCYIELVLLFMVMLIAIVMMTTGLLSVLLS